MNIMKIASLLTEKGAVKKIINENSQNLVSQLIAFLNLKFDHTPTGTEGVFLFPVDEKNVAVTLVVINDDGNPKFIGTCVLNEIVDMVPDNLMDLMK